MNVTSVANELIPLVGGKDNIVSAAHCATRLRLVLQDESKINKSIIEQVDGVKGCFSNAGQIQIIFGTGIVNKVYSAFIDAVGINEATESDVKKLATQKLNIAQRAARTLSNIFVPIIPAIVASGLLMGTLGLVRTYGWANPDSAIFIMLDMFSSAAFIILPILIGFTAAREFGGNPYLGATLGGILTHPALTNAWTVGSGFKSMDFFGIDVAMIGYQGTVFPVLIAVWFMSHLEKQLRRVVPNALDIILTPFLTVVITGFVALLFIGPAGRGLGDGITFVLTNLYEHAGWLAGLIFGGTYSAIVITGIHHSFHAIELGLLADKNVAVNFLLPIWARITSYNVCYTKLLRWQNDCEPLVKKLYPEVEKALRWLIEYAPSRMTGTGACVFGEFEDERHARDILMKIPTELQGFVARGENLSPLHVVLQQVCAENIA